MLRFITFSFHIFFTGADLFHKERDFAVSTKFSLKLDSPTVGS